MIDVWAAMAQAGWGYDLDERLFWKGENWVTFEQAERALFNAAHGVSTAEPANDDAGGDAA